MTTAPKKKAAGMKLSDLKILIVEDQPEARALLRNMLAEIGIHQVFDAPDGREALAFIDAAPDFIELVLCDWNMPGMNGVELLRQIRSVDPEMPFLMITGRSDLKSVVEAKSSGVTGYVRKPYSMTQLEAKLRIIMSKMEKKAAGN